MGELVDKILSGVDAKLNAKYRRRKSLYKAKRALHNILAEPEKYIESNIVKHDLAFLNKQPDNIREGAYYKKMLQASHNQQEFFAAYYDSKRIEGPLDKLTGTFKSKKLLELDENADIDEVLVDFDDVEDEPQAPKQWELVSTEWNWPQYETYQDIDASPKAETSKPKSLVMSKENKLIQDLSDEEILKKHEEADKKMAMVWEKIISKYENLGMEEQGDVVDLNTGEIIEDNGHLRGLQQSEFVWGDIINDETDDGDALNSEKSNGSEYNFEEGDTTENSDFENGEHIANDPSERPASPVLSKVPPGPRESVGLESIVTSTSPRTTPQVSPPAQKPSTNVQMQYDPLLISSPPRAASSPPKTKRRGGLI